MGVAGFKAPAADFLVIAPLKTHRAGIVLVDHLHKLPRRAGQSPENPGWFHVEPAVPCVRNEPLGLTFLHLPQI